MVHKRKLIWTTSQTLLGPSKLKHCWDRSEYKEQSWRLEETCCHLDSSRKPSTYVGVKNSQINKIIINIIMIIITLGNNFLLFEGCLDFYNWFGVFLHCWIRKMHPFLSIRSSFTARLIWKKSDLLTKSNKFLWHYQLIFVNTYHPKYVFKRTNILPTTYVDYPIETSITVNWMVGINKVKYT